MATTFIDTNEITRRSQLPGQGEVAEVLNQALCGAKNVLGMLRWLKAGETFDVKAQQKFQVLYLMDGKGIINLANKDYEVVKGAGIFLGVSENAVIRATNQGSLKLFHIMVPPIPK